MIKHNNTVFVLKRYCTKDAENDYNTEVDAFRKMRSPTNSVNIIGFYGSFVQEETYNVLLEFADKGTLEDYFQNTPPPSSGEDIVKLWRGLFDILNALVMIHSMPQNESEEPQVFQG